MQIKDARLGDLNVRAERAQSRFEEGEKRLFRPDGSKLYSEDEHDQQVGALEQERNKVLKITEEEARKIGLAAKSEVEHLENEDPIDSLTGDELERANLKRAFARDAAETLDAEAFSKRLEAVLAGGDKGSIFAYYMAAQRISKERGGRVPYVETLGRMEAALGGSDRAARVEAARQKEGEALEVESLAHHLQRGARNAVDSYLNQTYGTLR